MPCAVLMIDDDEVLSHLVEVRLTQMGDMVFRHAADGQRGLELAIADPPDLILLDFEMPVMDGLDTLRHLRANERTAHTPIVAFTASSGIGARHIEMVAGCDAYLPKPFNFATLSQTVQRLSGCSG